MVAEASGGFLPSSGNALAGRPDDHDALLTGGRAASRPHPSAIAAHRADGSRGLSTPSGRRLVRVCGLGPRGSCRPAGAPGVGESSPPGATRTGTTVQAPPTAVENCNSRQGGWTGTASGQAPAVRPPPRRGFSSLGSGQPRRQSGVALKHPSGPSLPHPATSLRAIGTIAVRSRYGPDRSRAHGEPHAPSRRRPEPRSVAPMPVPWYPQPAAFEEAPSTQARSGAARVAWYIDRAAARSPPTLPAPWIDAWRLPWAAFSGACGPGLYDSCRAASAHRRLQPSRKPRRPQRHPPGPGGLNLVPARPRRGGRPPGEGLVLLPDPDGQPRPSSGGFRNLRVFRSR